MIDEVLRKLIEFVQEASPLIWQTLVKQVYAEAVGHVVWLVAAVGLSVLIYRFCIWMKKIDDEANDTDITLQLVGWVALILLGAFITFQATESFKMFFNPEYYAIKLILANMGGG